MIQLMRTSLLSANCVSEARPVAVGGLGGSGTRVVVSLLEELGFDMGNDLNESKDDLTFTALFKRKALWPPQAHLSELKQALECFISSRYGLCPSGMSVQGHLSRAQAMLDNLIKESSWHDGGSVTDRLKGLEQIGQGSVPWGWKEPNTHLFLTYLLSALPNMKYIHVVRNGLDMAHSANQNQLVLWGERLVGRPVNPASPQDAFAFWCAAHERLLTILSEVPKRILLVQYESLLTNEQAAVDRLAEFLSLDISTPVRARWRRTIKASETVGRHCNEPALRISAEQLSVLERIGYRVTES